MKNLRFRVSLVTILLVSLLVAGCGQQPEEKSQQEEEKIPVQVTEVTRDKLAETTVVSGKLQAAVSSDVVPSGQGGKVKAVRVSVGDWVKRGQTMVVLENNTLAASLNQSKAALAQAEAAYELASNNYERGKKLLEQGAIAQATFESKYENNYKQAKAGLDQAKAGLKTAQERYNNSFIKAPISGTVTAVNVDPGEMAAASAGPVVSIANYSSVVVEASVAEYMVNKLQPGSEVEVNIDAVPGGPYTGKVTSVAPAANRNSKTFPVEVQLANPEGKFKPGMFAEINFVQTHSENIVVPREAVVGSAGEFAAWVVEDGTAHRRSVEKGPGNDHSVIINSGLEEGEKVVTAGAGDLNEGAEVIIKK